MRPAHPIGAQRHEQPAAERGLRLWCGGRLDAGQLLPGRRLDLGLRRTQSTDRETIKEPAGR